MYTGDLTNFSICGNVLSQMITHVIHRARTFHPKATKDRRESVGHGTCLSACHVVSPKETLRGFPSTPRIAHGLKPYSRIFIGNPPNRSIRRGKTRLFLGGHRNTCSAPYSASRGRVRNRCHAGANVSILTRRKRRRKLRH